MSGIKACKNAWITADKYNFIFTRLVAKTEKAYQSDIKRAKKKGHSMANVKKYTVEESYFRDIEQCLDRALEYSLRDSKLLKEDGLNNGKKPVGAKKIEELSKLVKSIKKDIKETFSNSLGEFNRDALLLKQENESLKEQIKKLKIKLESNG